MRAVVMAGGEGTRLRPLTTNVPKPLLPVVGEPIMGHLLRLLHRHGIGEAVVTVQYLAGSIRSYFGDGAEYGVQLSYATESVPLGTAGSVKNAERGLRGEPFLVVSGDALTDIDLSELLQVHRDRDAMVTVALARKPNVLDFGNVTIGEDGRVERFIEKPTWGQVVSDTVNTGIYVMQPEVLDLVPADERRDWSVDVLPRLLADGGRVFGHVSEAYWEDVGTIDSYLAVQGDVLLGRVEAHISGFEVAPSVWLGEGAVVDPAAQVASPCFIGAHATVERDCVVGPGTVLGSNVVLRRGARVVGSLLDSAVYVGTGGEITSAIIGRGAEIRARARVGAQSVVADQCLLGEETRLEPGVHVYPGKQIDAGAVISDNVIWEAKAHRSLFGQRGVSGVVNLDITPEMVVRLAAAYAALLPKGSTVTVGRDHSRAARAMNRALAGSLTAAGLDVRDLRITPLPIVRSDASRAAQGGVYLRTTLGLPESLDLLLLDATGSDLSVPEQKKLERILVRRDFRRAFPGEIGDIHTPHRSVDEYAVQLASSIDTSGVTEADLKVVIDTGAGAAALVLPRILSTLGISVLTVNNRLDEEHPTSTSDSYHMAMERLGELVSSSRSDLGVRFDPTGERLSLVDETGRAFDHGRALLVMLDLVAAERRSGVVAVPAQTTWVAREVASYHGVGVVWTGVTTAALAAQAQQTPGLVFAGDGRGGFIVPEVGPNVDGIAAFVRLVGLVARTKLTLSAIGQRIPASHVARAGVPTPWARRGAMMRTLVEAAGDRVVETSDGVRIAEADGSRVLAVPDQTEAVIRLWVEATSQQRAEELLTHWYTLIEAAAR
jgi:mannose-1-phosphate guanylyltransferase/phosphomannomutase